MKVLGKVAWLVGLGCLPFWVALAWLLINGIGEGDDYWSVAPWAVVAAIPLSLVTLAMAAITSKVYVATEGGELRKLMYAGACYAGLWTVALAIAWSLWSERKADEATLEAQKDAGQALVERSTLVASVAPRGFRVSTRMWARNRDGTASRLYYSVYASGAPAESLMVIVEPAMDSPARELAIRCIVPIDAFQKADSHADRCQLPESIRP